MRVSNVQIVILKNHFASTVWCASLIQLSKVLTTYKGECWLVQANGLKQFSTGHNFFCLRANTQKQSTVAKERTNPGKFFFILDLWVSETELLLVY